MSSPGSPISGCASAASSAAMWQHSHPVLSLWTLHSNLLPTLHSGCQLWEMHGLTGEAKAARLICISITHIPQMHLWGRTCSSCCVIGECAVPPIEVFWQQFWNALAASFFELLFRHSLDSIYDAFFAGRGTNKSLAPLLCASSQWGFSCLVTA